MPSGQQSFGGSGYANARWQASGFGFFWIAQSREALLGGNCNGRLSIRLQVRGRETLVTLVPLSVSQTLITRKSYQQPSRI